ncbi:hypothetical protein GW17_00047619 [Ensete ventricosum]|nr:hypothetical protein GW17_00047619 [Ensete ventricosum]
MVLSGISPSLPSSMARSDLLKTWRCNGAVGGRGEAFGANEAGSLLYRRHKHPLHIRWARCHSVSRHNTLVPSKYRA